MKARYADRFVLVRSPATGDVRWELQASNGRIRHAGNAHSKWYKRKASMVANLRSTNPRWWTFAWVDRTGVGDDASRPAETQAPAGFGTRAATAARL